MSILPLVSVGRSVNCPSTLLEDYYPLHAGATPHIQRGCMETNQQRREPFDNHLGRLMVSLGPLSDRKYCTYSCPFCYVHSGFAKYARMSANEIIAWASAQDRSTYDIVYVSGDTDSFAAPRTNEGLRLLEALSQLNVDLLFTTRTVFDESQMAVLAAIAQAQRESGHLLFGCVSIAQWRQPDLEPRPIPAVTMRMAQLARFKERGLVAVLAMRPFLPPQIVSTDEYQAILDAATALDFRPDIILGEDWYANDVLEAQVFGDSRPPGLVLRVGAMDFSDNDAEWRIYENEAARKLAQDICDRHGIFFSMRSGPAVAHMRKLVDQGAWPSDLAQAKSCPPLP